MRIEIELIQKFNEIVQIDKKQNDLCNITENKMKLNVNARFKLLEKLVEYCDLNPISPSIAAEHNY